MRTERAEGQGASDEEETKESGEMMNECKCSGQAGVGGVI